MTTVFRVLGAMAVLSPAVCFGEVIFHDPIPYRSIADSPFDMSGLGKTFFFDDFEDGTFDFPDGVFSSPFTIETPGPLTDSVDADDGDIDGNGSGGHALKPEGGIIIDLTNPPHIIQHYSLQFDLPLLGMLPRSFGIALTDGMENSLLAININEVGSEATHVYWPPLDSSYTGGTDEDRFYSATSTVGIRSLSVSSVRIGLPFVETFELDHMQIGFPVPEPPELIGSLSIALFLASRFARPDCSLDGPFCS